MDRKEYKPLTIPRLSWDKKTLKQNYGELVAQPLEPGFGMTLGNALRRVLLGGVEGSAVTSVIIKGVNNEFSTLEGVVEDAMQVVLNCKEIVIRNAQGKPGTMKLSVSGKDVVTAADIVADKHLEVVNTEHVIAHLSPGGSLDIEFFVETGRAYRAAAWPEGKPLQEDDRIFLDAMFSPVQKVTFDVEKTRVGSEIDYDKLIIRIWTNGSENPLDVLHYAVSVLRTQLEHFLASSEIPFNEISKVEPDQKVAQPLTAEDLGLQNVSLDLLFKPIDDLELSVRAHNCLVTHGIKRVIDLVNLDEDTGLKIKNFGRKSLNEVKDSLKGFGLTFGMNIDEEEVKRLLKQKQEA